MSKEINILVVEDDKAIRDLFYRALPKKRYHVEAAESGREALKCLKKQKYQIVILDIKIPEPKGMDVLKIIKRSYPGVEVIMVSGHGTMRMIQESLQLGAYDYLTKPVDIHDLLDTIERISKCNFFLKHRREVFCIP